MCFTYPDFVTSGGGYTKEEYDLPRSRNDHVFFPEVMLFISNIKLKYFFTLGFVH